MVVLDISHMELWDIVAGDSLVDMYFRAIVVIDAISIECTVPRFVEWLTRGSPPDVSPMELEAMLCVPPCQDMDFPCTE